MAAEQWQELLDRALSGDTDAMGALCQGYLRPKVFSLAFSRLKQRQDAEDVVQRVFEKLITHSQNIRKRELKSFEAFVLTVTRHACIDFVRKKAPNVPYLEQSPETATDATPQQTFDKQELQDLLATAIEEELDDMERFLLTMKVVQHLPYREISEETDIPVSTLHDRCQKAFGKLSQRPELRAYWEAFTGGGTDA